MAMSSFPRGLGGRFARLFAAAALLIVGLAPANASVTITFWSRDFGTYFPHAFFTLNGRPDHGGAVVNESYGFTAKSLSPALLMGTVPGRIDKTADGYILHSHPQFSLVLTDAQFAAVEKLVEDWGDNGDHHYNLHTRNCVHFVAEAARRSGLNVATPTALMGKPHAFLDSLVPLNRGKVTIVTLPADQYLTQVRALH
jgi:hypothetical protein